MRILTAKWIAGMQGPMIRDGAVAFEGGKITAIDHRDILQRNFPTATIENMGQSVILPGLVNAHTHLELSESRCEKTTQDSFENWLNDRVKQTNLDPAEIERRTIAGLTTGVAQCLRFGVTTAGDISRQCGITRRLLKDSPLRVTSYGEVTAMAQRRGLLEERLAAAMDTTWASERLRIGITPHAPYSVEAAGYRRCLEAAKESKLPLATHLAESRAENLFLAKHTGPLREMWEAWGAWDENVGRFEGGAIRYAKSLGLLDYPTLLAHVNYCDDQEMELLAGGCASVVYCPRTHAYFRHPPHRFAEMMKRGINVAVGTDSCASSPDLNLVEELRLIHRIEPGMEAAQIWSMATIAAAKAIHRPAEVGTIQAGKAADFVVFNAAGENPLKEVLENQILPASVWIGGERLATGPAQSN